MSGFRFTYAVDEVTRDEQPVFDADQLTARGVQDLLARARVDCSQITITDDSRVWTDLESGRRGTSVIIAGPREPRRAASEVLYGSGYGCAPYSDHDEWSRR